VSRFPEASMTILLIFLFALWMVAVMLWTITRLRKP
jgi:hypothetical protein